jgi:hypothetical protein
MQDEMDSLDRLHTWDLVELLTGRKALEGK